MAKDKVCIYMYIHIHLYTYEYICIHSSAYVHIDNVCVFIYVSQIEKSLLVPITNISIHLKCRVL
jgi:hypothetical protein